MKRSFFLLEFIIVLVILGIIYSIFVPKKYTSKLDEVSNRVLIYLHLTRFKALSDDVYFENTSSKSENFWHKRRWTMKFQKCRIDKGGGIYFSIYTDKNDKGHINKEESLKDPLTNKYIYTSNACEIQADSSPFVLLKNYGVKDVQISCNNTSSLGQISFGEDGKVYSKLSHLERPYDYEIKSPCIIRFVSNTEEYREIIIHPHSGYIELLNKK